MIVLGDATVEDKLGSVLQEQEDPIIYCVLKSRSTTERMRVEFSLLPLIEAEILTYCLVPVMKYFSMIGISTSRRCSHLIARRAIIWS